jgi:hypothetical protein
MTRAFAVLGDRSAIVAVPPPPALTTREALESVDTTAALRVPVPPPTVQFPYVALTPDPRENLQSLRAVSSVSENALGFKTVPKMKLRFPSVKLKLDCRPLAARACKLASPAVPERTIRVAE